MKETFGWTDYVIFGFMLLVSIGTGIYHGLYKKQNTAKDYLLGGKQMGVAPIAISLIIGCTPGVMLLSLPGDIYRYGISFILSAPTFIFAIAGAYFIYLPVFYKLEITSIYEYFNMRFNNKIRVLASFLFVINKMLVLPIYIFVPALALSQVTNIPTNYIIPVVCTVCIFYTTLGGIKAAVWTDTLQFGILFGSLVLVVVIGVIDNGGLLSTYEKSSAGNRMDIKFDFSATERDTFWSNTIIVFFSFMYHIAGNQGVVQKCLTLPSYKSVKIALLLAAIGTLVVQILSMFSGLVMYAHYFGCDPLKQKVIKTYDQILPLYVMEISRFVPGLPGLFISGIFSASLSSMSAYLNCLAAVIYQDFISPFIPKGTSEETISRYLKLIVVVCGIFSTTLVFVVKKLGSLLALTISISGISGGPLLGLFTAGMLIPMVHTKGALYGGITSFIISGWIIMGAQWYKLTGALHYPPLPVFTDKCNVTTAGANDIATPDASVIHLNADESEVEAPFILFRISFYYYIFIGAMITIFVSVVVSYFTKRDKPLNKTCLSPIIQFTVKDKTEKPPNYYTIDKAIEILDQKQ